MPIEMPIDIDEIVKTQTNIIDAPYRKLTTTTGQVDLEQFDETWHQRIKMCVVKCLTGLRTKKIDWA